MADTLQTKAPSLGIGAVFLTAISTILGAIMFLRFGYAVGNVGLLGTLAIIALGHAVTIPTAMAIAEIATNQRVEGGGVYYIISRSFGLNIGAAIGVALYFSQAISVAFYIIAFGEAFDPVFAYVNQTFDLQLSDPRIVTLPTLALLGALIVTRGADFGIKVLYIVVGSLVVALAMFFYGTPTAGAPQTIDFLAAVPNGDGFFYVFAIIFPAFTGMAAGVGLSGDLRDPKSSIPRGTLWATVGGMLIYVTIAFKLHLAASPQELATDYLIMSEIAIWGPIIPIGLAAATLSSTLGSILVAPRTLEALGKDGIFTPGFNTMLVKKNKHGEPIPATIVSLLIALVFVVIGDVNAVAEVITMFFMVTYGAICAISFFQHFAADPSYRPAFRSRWLISLVGAVLCVYLMFAINPAYAGASLPIMGILYVVVTRYNPNRQGLARIFQGVIFQLSRRLQVFLQKTDKDDPEHWRPSVICISDSTFKRSAAFDMIRYISHRYGFGTYLHSLNGYVSRETTTEARATLKRLIHLGEASRSNVYLNTLISPSYTTAIAQSIQMPGVSGKDNNMFLFEYTRDGEEELNIILENMKLVKASNFDIGILSSTERGFGYRSSVHIWIGQNDYENANLMILLAYIILGHPDWKRAQIKIFAIFPEQELAEQRKKLESLTQDGRIPISPQNIEVVSRQETARKRDVIQERSAEADLVMVGFLPEQLKQKGAEMFQDYEGLANILFLHSGSGQEKVIE